MTQPPFSPADHLPAVAVSEANAWRDAVLLCASRMRAGGPGQQTDARLLVLALRQVIRAGELTSRVVAACPAAVQIAGEARDRLAAACPDLDQARNVLEHFDEYAAGAGYTQAGGRGKPAKPAKAAADWPFGYDPQAGQIQVGRYRIDVRAACEQAKLMAYDIWRAVRAYEDAGQPTA